MSLDSLAAATAPKEEVAPVETPAETAVETAVETPVEKTDPTVDEIVNGSQPEVTPEPVEQPEWLQSKYVTDDRSQEESIAEQAKAYSELSKKFGSFKGAPEEYGEFAFNEDLAKVMEERGISMLSTDDPLMQGMGEIAKEMNMSQEGYNQFAEAFVANQIKQEDARIANVVSELGENAPARIKEIQQWQLGLEPEIKALTDAVATSTEGIELLEHFMSKSNKMPEMQRLASEENTVANPQAALDALVADPRYKTDANYRAEVAKKASKLFPGTST